MYRDGVAVPQDHEEALTWYRRAADQGDAAAQAALGTSYLEGKAVPRDIAQAIMWFRKAADEGHHTAQLALGLLYEDGRGVPQDYVQAHKWANLAAAVAVGEARTVCANAREKIAAKMTAGQIGAAQRLAREWKEAFDRRKK